MSSGFVSAGKTQDFDDTNPKNEDANDEPVAEPARDAWTAADATIQASRKPEVSVDDGRSLFDILQANKARKQEEFEEKLKFKNQFRALDEDEIDFLDSIVSSERTAEDARKKELESKLDDFRRLQYDADHDATAATGEKSAEAETWAVGRKRRKKDKEKEGLKVRKMSDGSRRESEVKAKDEEEKVAESKDVAKTTTKDAAEIVKTAATENEAKKTGGLGLVAYDSDSE